MSAKDQPPESPFVTRDHELLSSLVMTDLPARVWVKDSSGRYVFVNSRLTSELGIDREKWIGSKDDELFPNVGHVYWRKDLQVLSSGNTLVTTDQVEKGKTIFVVRFLLDVDGQPHVAAVGLDTTEHISALIGIFQLRDELFRSERLRSIGEMASGFAHDLKNILNAGAIRLNILRAKAGSGLTGDLDALDRTIKAAADRARSLQDFVNARPQETLEPSDLSVLIREAVEMVDFLIFKSPTVNGGTINLERKLPASLPKVPTFPNQLKHVIANLLINGREAMPDGGNLLIEAKKNTSNVEVVVADEGTGISADIAEKIFDPFFTTKQMGTGLGLSMARDVMTRIGGDIRVVNRAPRGAAFTLIFPIPASSAPGTGAPNADG